MSKETNHIDELFKAKLNSDMPVYRDEYWQGFEQMLNNLPPQPASGSSPTDAGTGTAASSSSAGSSVSAGSTAAVTATGTATGSGMVGSWLAGGLVVKAVIGISTLAMISTAVWFGIGESVPEPATEPALFPATETVQPAQTTDSLISAPSTPADPASAPENSATSALPISKGNASPAGASAASASKGTVPVAVRMSSAASAPKAGMDQFLNPSATLTPVAKSLSDPHSAGSGGEQTAGNTTEDPSVLISNNLQPIPSKVPAGSPEKESVPEQAEMQGSPENPVSPDPETLNTSLTKDEPAGTDVPQTPDLATQNLPQNPVQSDSLPAKPADREIPGLTGSSNLATAAGSAVPLKEYPFGLSLVGGAAFARSIGNSAGFDPAWHASLYIGINLEYRLNPWLGIAIEPGVHRLSGWELRQQSIQTYTFFDTRTYMTTIKNRELEVFGLPVMVRLSQGRHALSAGPCFLYLLSASGESDQLATTPSGTMMSHDKAENYLNGLNRLQYGISADYSLNIYQRHAAFVRYSHYFNGTVSDSGAFPDYQDRKLGVLLIGFRIKAF